jgi:hypothetical protein
MFGRRALTGASLASFALAIVGCSTPAVDDVADASTAMTQGLIVVEREASFEAEPQASVSAKFMRLSPGVEPDVAERVVGAHLELPAVGTCVQLPASEEVPPLAERASIELLDVGDVTVSFAADEAESNRLPLATRAFPDVGDVVSGVFYTTREDAELSDGNYRIAASGSQHLESFSISADAPAPLEDVRIDGDALADVPALVSGRAVTVRWDGSQDARDEDRVVIDIVASSGAVTRCSFADSGRGTIPGAALDPRTLGNDSASIEVHRVRRAFFGNSAIEAGEVRFDLSVLGRVAVSPSAD